MEAILSLKQLRAFSTVVAAGSTLAASERLRISQPAICYSLDRLEGELSAVLLERNVSGSYPTAAGKLLHNRITRLFAQMIDAVRHVFAAGEHGAEKSEALVRKLRENQVRALIGIWRAGSFRAAARELAVTEPSLQRPARELERLLRVNLYRRAPVGMEVNPTGAELARRLSVALDEIRCAIEEVSGAPPSSSASVRVGVLALAPRAVVADAAIKLLASRPQQRIDIVEAPYEKHIAALRSGDIDLIFGALRTPPPFDDVVEERLYEDPYLLICGPSHPLARAGKVEPRQLAKYDFVFPSRGLPRRAVLDRMLAAWKIEPRACIETSCLPTIVTLLRNSDRISLLSRWHVSDSSGLCGVDVKGARFGPRFVGLATRAQCLPTPFQQEFLRLIRHSSEACKTPTLSEGVMEHA